MDERRRNLWPLPGGARSYASNLRILLKGVGEGKSRSDLEKVVGKLAPTVRSASTLRGYAAVPITLGFVEPAEGRALRLTHTGERYARTGDLSVLRRTLVDRVLGIEELLQEVAKGPTTCRVLTERLAEQGIAWNHPMAVRYRVWWLVSARAVDAVRDSRVDRLSLSRPGRQLLARRRS